ncbi:MAG: hypothetical protein ACREOY_00515 [Candidatus Dormibacteraceae bacterium]
MSESLIRKDVVDAIDEIRKPPTAVIPAVIAAIHLEHSNSKAPRIATAIAVVLTIGVVSALFAVASFRNANTAGSSRSVQAGSATCELPVRTDQGPGLLMYPSGSFRPASLPAAAATAYNPATHSWLATEPQGISPDGKLVALLDNKKGHKQTLRLETSSGKLLYSRDLVMRILGWSSDGSLLVTTVDAPARLLRINRDGRTDWIDPLSNATTMWSFAAFQYVWGVALPYPDAHPERVVVRLDLLTRTVTNWYAMPLDSFNDSGGGPILGVTSDGYPIVPQLKTDSQSAVYVIRSKDTAIPLYVSSGDEMTPSLFWPSDATSGSKGTWVTTTDGELYRSSGAGSLELVNLQSGLHVLSLGGTCR